MFGKEVECWWPVRLVRLGRREVKGEKSVVY